MKNSILSFVLLISAILFSSVSCSSDGGNSNPPPTPNNEDTWKLDNYNFSRLTSNQTSTTYVNGNPFTILNIDSNTNNSNDPFKTCNLTIIFNTSTTGNYTIKSQTSVVSNTTQKIMDIRCIVSNGLGSGATYESIDSNLTATVTQINGKFVVLINEPITLNRTSNNGLSQAPQTFTFRCNNVR
ncbi:hypothetical protein [Flavobacterium sp. TBRC 19031]|uniref:hypothetical protein n=1 Tax=Flavobacterium mekongense TaxID=3379707 RepID=UPI00399A67F8